MKQIFFFVALFTLTGLLSCNSTADSRWEILSEDGAVKMELFLEDGMLHYTASLKNGNDFSEIIKKSPLGITRDDAGFTENLEFIGASDVTRIDEHYKVLTGKALNLHNLANERIVSFSSSGGNRLDVALRAYNDGVAFRYIFPEEITGNFVVNGEITGFRFGEGIGWIQPYDDVTKWTPAYEAHYMNEVPIGETSPYKNGWCFPALFHTEDAWVLLTEAGLDGDFYGAHLNGEVPGGLYTIRLPEEEETMGVYGQFAESESLPWASPWRVAIIGRDLNTIATSDMVKHLSPPNRIEDTSWIKPGRASWSWLSDHDSPQDYGKLRSFIDLAVEMGWEYSLVDANWNMMKGGDLNQLVEYANSKNIGILLWYNSGGPHNEVGEQVRDLMHIPEVRQKEFAKLQEWGVKGVKIDFFQSDKPGMMKLYRDILEDAARYNIMVNFHGCAIPRGWSRTWPNLMTLESVRGAECYTFASNYPENAPISNTILPVTRNVVGSMDFTPVLFTEMQYPHITTYSHELALSVLFESGWLHFADGVEAYRNLPEIPKNFLKTVPVVWDETRYVAGWPGKDMVLARRKGDTWFVAGINGENQPKSLSFQMPFLSDGNYQAELITDGATNRSFSTKNMTVGNDSAIELPMIANGGFVMKIHIK
jgi:alpha-glucosidase